MPQIHAFVSRDAAHGWNGLAVRLGVSTSGLIEAVGQLLAENHLCDKDVPEFDKLTSDLADRARTIDAVRRQRKGRLLGGLVPAGASAAIVRAARVAVHRPVASASAGVLAIATVGGATAAIARLSPPSSRPAAASGLSSLPTAYAQGNGPVLPVSATTTSRTAPTTVPHPTTATVPSSVPTETAPPPAEAPAPATTTTASPPAEASAPATATNAPPAADTQVTAGPVSASVSAGSSSAQVNAQAGPVNAQASVTPSSASVSAQTPVAQAQVKVQVPAVSSTTSGVVGAVKKVAGSILGS